MKLIQGKLYRNKTKFVKNYSNNDVFSLPAGWFGRESIIYNSILIFIDYEYIVDSPNGNSYNLRFVIDNKEIIISIPIKEYDDSMFQILRKTNKKQTEIKE